MTRDENDVLFAIYAALMVISVGMGVGMGMVQYGGTMTWQTALTVGLLMGWNGLLTWKLWQYRLTIGNLCRGLEAWKNEVEEVATQPTGVYAVGDEAARGVEKAVKAETQAASKAYQLSRRKAASDGVALTRGGYPASRRH